MKFFLLKSGDEIPAVHLQGYAFTSSDLVFNTGGLKKYYTEINDFLYKHVEAGRFFLVEWDSLSSDLIIKTDPSGQYLIYYYSEGNDWIVSDSILALVQEMKRQNKPVTSYRNSIDVFKNDRLSLIGGQLVSNNTVVSGVKVLAANSFFKIHYNDGIGSLVICKNESSFSKTSYEQYVSTYITLWRARTRALSQLGMLNYLALSGGVDSRAVLGLLSSNKSHNVVKSHSHALNSTEYSIAQKLCEVAGTPFVKGQSGKGNKELSPDESYAFSMLGNAGIKTNFGFKKNIVKNKSLHYIGGSVIGSFYMKSSFQQRANAIRAQYDKKAADNVIDEISESFEDIGVDKDDPWAMFHHYYSFRARFHYGNEAFSRATSIQVHPFLDSFLHKIPFFLDKEYVSRNGFMRDIIAVSNVSLLSVSFDSPDKLDAGESMLNTKNIFLEMFDYNLFFEENFDAECDSQNFRLQQKQWYEELVNIVGARKESVKDIGVEFGFSDDFIHDALSELNRFTGKESLKKSGLLLSLFELF